MLNLIKKSIPLGLLISGAIGDISVEYNLKAPASCDPGKIISDNDTTVTTCIMM